MSERNDDDRIRFTAIADLSREAEARVVPEVMRRIAATRAKSRRAMALREIELLWRPSLAAAAILAAIAVSTLVRERRRVAPDVSSVDGQIIEWAQREHVPTNGELLATFQGYAP